MDTSTGGFSTRDEQLQDLVYNKKSGQDMEMSATRLVRDTAVGLSPKSISQVDPQVSDVKMSHSIQQNDPSNGVREAVSLHRFQFQYPPQECSMSDISSRTQSLIPFPIKIRATGIMVSSLARW